MREQMRLRHVPGLALAVVRDGRVIKESGYGLANVELEVPVSSSTVFEIGSISKQITAAAVMMLVEEGKVYAPSQLGLDALLDFRMEVTLTTILRIQTSFESGISKYEVAGNLSTISQTSAGRVPFGEQVIAVYRSSIELERDQAERVAPMPMRRCAGDSRSASSSCLLRMAAASRTVWSVVRQIGAHPQGARNLNPRQGRAARRSPPQPEQAPSRPPGPALRRLAGIYKCRSAAPQLAACLMPPRQLIELAYRQQITGN